MNTQCLPESEQKTNIVRECMESNPDVDYETMNLWTRGNGETYFDATDDRNDDSIDRALDEAFINHVCTVHVTRACTKEERGSKESGDARKKEFDKILGFETLRRPVGRKRTVALARERKNALTDTISGFMMLDAIKHCELKTDQWVFKGRGVCLGHRLYELVTGARVPTKGTFGDTWSAVASLTALRTVFAHSLVHQFPVKNWDVINAYLNIEYPTTTHQQVSLGFCALQASTTKITNQLRNNKVSQ